MATVLEEIHKLVEKLPLDHQRRVLEFAQKLTQADQDSVPLSVPTTPLPPGTPGSALLQLRFKSSREDTEAMERALEDCERIEVDCCNSISVRTDAYCTGSPFYLDCRTSS